MVFHLWVNIIRRAPNLVLAAAFLLAPFTTSGYAQQTGAAVDEPARGVLGPYLRTGAGPAVFNGDLRDLPQLPAVEAPQPSPLRYIPGQEPKGGAPQTANWSDPVAQQSFGAGQMPAPIRNFAGLDLANWGSGWPPDTNGDIGPNHYIQSVNTSIGIYDKTNGTRLAAFTFDDFFTGPAGTPCDNNNQGDPVVLYDPYVDRWVITDFAWNNFTLGPFYECIAVSQSGNPVSGGWYFYALEADAGLTAAYLNDYPKLGVWADGWYMSANMFLQSGIGPNFYVRVWVLDKAAMLSGGALRQVVFDCLDTTCASLLPSNARGALPPAGAPNYFAAVGAPDQFYLWEFDVDWTTPANSTFTGPTALTIADFAIAPSIPQPGTTNLLDSLSFRLMMQLQYRYLDGVEALWVTHSVASGGVVGTRWYEVRDPGGAPVVFQQGTYQPDSLYRWMGSAAVDQDGNMAIGYSVSDKSIFPSIRYAGRLAGESPGLLPQNEASLMVGSGSQIGTNRWGDYSTMTVDPVDDCTFWYTTEYLAVTGSNWLTRIGSFKYPSCGQPKAYIQGVVRNAVTGAPVAAAPVTASAAGQSLSVQTDLSGYYTMTLLAGSFTLTAGPLLPGYPEPTVIPGVSVVTGAVSTQDINLAPAPSLVLNGQSVDDSVPGGNGNGFPEPGESGLLYYQSLENVGAITSTNVSAYLQSGSAGLIIGAALSGYPDIPAGQVKSNSPAFSFSIQNTVACGATLLLQELVTDTVQTYHLPSSINASILLPRTNVFLNDVEAGLAGWTTGGVNNTWAITTLEAHSPTHSWTDSPAGSYLDNTNAYVRTPAINLSGKRKIQVSGWFKYGLEPGYDYVYLEYSLDGGGSWSSLPLMILNGYQTTWQQRSVEAGVLDNQPNVALRFRLETDAGVTDTGIFLDDIALSYEPYECAYAYSAPPDSPSLVSPADGGSAANPVSFTWQPALTGGLPDGYVLWIDGSPVSTYTTPTTSGSALLSIGAHTWTVAAFNNGGSSGPAPARTVNVTVAPPARPVLVSPADNAEIANRDTPVQFEWAAGNGGNLPTGYRFYLDGVLNETFTTPVTTTVMTLPVGLHNWYVIAFNSSGDSPQSQARSLSVLPYPPAPPVLVTPQEGANLTSPVTFQWLPGSGGDAEQGFVLWLDEAPVITLTAGTTNTQRALTLGAHTWSVSAFNDGGSTPAAETRSLTVLPDLPGIPLLLDPPDLAQTTSPVTFTWQAGTGGEPTGYVFYLDGIPVVSFSTPVTSTQLALAPGEHIWSVRAVNDAGGGPSAVPRVIKIIYPVYLPWVSKK